MKKEEVIVSLIKEIENSGKKFKDISKKSIVDYISFYGITNRKDIDSIYDYVFNYFNKSYTSSTSKDKSNDNFKDNCNVIMEDINLSNNEIKQRTPRKSIFSEIKKI